MEDEIEKYFEPIGDDDAMRKWLEKNPGKVVNSNLNDLGIEHHSIAMVNLIKIVENVNSPTSLVFRLNF